MSKMRICICFCAVILLKGKKINEQKVKKRIKYNRRPREHMILCCCAFYASS